MKTTSGEIPSDGAISNVPVPRFTAELKAKWIAALRSGEYRQCRGELRDLDGRYCCMGVLAFLCGADTEFLTGSTTSNAIGYRPISLSDANYLAETNDHGQRFPEIADYIEANIPAEE